MNNEEITQLKEIEKIKFVAAWDMSELETSFDKQINLDKEMQYGFSLSLKFYCLFYSFLFKLFHRDLSKESKHLKD